MPAPPQSRLDAKLHPVSEQQLHPPLGRWSRVWRYLLAGAVGAAAWIAASAVGLSVPLTGSDGTGLTIARSSLTWRSVR